MKTVKDNFLEMLEKIVSQTGTLIEQFSSMRPTNKPGDLFVVINPNGNYEWQALPVEGKQLQTTILNDFRKFASLMDVYLCALSEASQQYGTEAIRALLRLIEQNGTTWYQTPAEAVKELNNTNAVIREVLNHFAATTEEVYAVPDTNAFLTNPFIEKWNFKGIDRFCVILAPSVLAELDKHKINHRNENVRNKAEQLINQFKEYGRRGSLLDGVTVRKNHITLKAIAHEPDMANSLSWFDKSNADDRFLATVLEIMKEYIGAGVFCVTRDINMQNKAEAACIPYFEPPAEGGSR